MNVKLTAIVITKNEEKTIEECLYSLLPIADEVIIVDDYSTDKTIEIAKKYSNVKIFLKKFINFSEQRNFAISKVDNGLMLFIDADERVNHELQNEILKLKRIPIDKLYEGYYIKIATYVWDKKIKHGNWKPHYKLRLFKKGYLWTGKVHEVPNIPTKNIGYIKKGEIKHFTLTHLNTYIHKIIKYSSLEAQHLAENNVRFKLFNLFWKPLFFFLKSYIYRLGFMDGLVGLYYNLLCIFYEILIQIRLWEITRKCK